MENKECRFYKECKTPCINCIKRKDCLKNKISGNLKCSNNNAVKKCDNKCSSFIHKNFTPIEIIKKLRDGK